MTAHPVPSSPFTVAVRSLADRNMTVAVAESFTDGRMSAALHLVSGARTVWPGWASRGAERLEAEVVGVDTERVVCREAAEVLAEQARALQGTDLGLGLTGVAGPAAENGTRAGTVFVAVARRGVPTRTTQLWLPGPPDSVRAAAAAAAMGMVVEVLAEQRCAAA